MLLLRKNRYIISRNRVDKIVLIYFSHIFLNCLRLARLVKHLKLQQKKRKSRCPKFGQITVLSVVQYGFTKIMLFHIGDCN